MHSDRDSDRDIRMDSDKNSDEDSDRDSNKDSCVDSEVEVQTHQLSGLLVSAADGHVAFHSGSIFPRVSHSKFKGRLYGYPRGFPSS